MGSKASTPVSSGTDDSPSRQIYSRAEQVSDYESSLRQQAQNDSIFVEMRGRNHGSSERVHHQHIHRSIPVGSDRASGEQLGGPCSTSLDTATRLARLHAADSNAATPPVPSRSYSIGSPASGPAVSRSESTSSSMSSSAGGLTNFLSSFNLWRSSSAAGPSDRQRTQSLSHMHETASGHAAPAGPGRSDEEAEESVMSNPRAALTRLLSSGRSESRSLGTGQVSSESNTHHPMAFPGQPSSHQRGQQQPRDTFSVRDLTFAAAQEFLAEATLSGLGLGRVYVTHSLPSHMWAVNGKQLLQSCSSFAYSLRPLSRVVHCRIRILHERCCFSWLPIFFVVQPYGEKKKFGCLHKTESSADQEEGKKGTEPGR